MLHQPTPQFQTSPKLAPFSFLRFRYCRQGPRCSFYFLTESTPAMPRRHLKELSFFFFTSLGVQASQDDSVLHLEDKIRLVEGWAWHRLFHHWSDHRSEPRYGLTQFLMLIQASIKTHTPLNTFTPQLGRSGEESLSVWAWNSNHACGPSPSP